MRIDSLGVVHSPWTLVTRALQIVLFGIVTYGIIEWNVRLVVNGIVLFAITGIPSLIKCQYDYRVDPRLTVWIAVAAVVHIAGFLGPYNTHFGLLSFYDSVAHAISASFVAGVSYALIVALDQTSTRIRFPAEFRFVFTLCFIMAFGVTWEIIEFIAGHIGSLLGGEEALVQYGIQDTILDLLFNLFAAVIVALWGTQYFRGPAALISRLLLRSGNP